ncbi:hypothetical protein DFH07DRAFT_965393 [Mycena maculata]|uniref:Uncharacterized protein n=1 Tax=Mycena maculata TaxID=230809 RepID=A0AAD7N0F4_9AGAR|nr:hypothetical protein DFH07DRAFT_965393 [Mycena maculata]
MTATSSSLFFLLLCLPSLTLPHPALALSASGRSPATVLGDFWPWRRANAPRSEPAAGYYPPADGGGAMLTEAPGTFPPAGEPLNIIIAGTSSPAVLVDQQNDGGFRNYILSIGFASECLGQHEGDAQMANLGDGNGYVNETAELRWDYGDPSLGTCEETIQGGDHFRYWVQNGPSANSSAIFMASSYEMPIAEGHNIVVNGYNLGRDWLLGNITGSPINTSALTNTSTFSGDTEYAGFKYSTSIQYVGGLLSASGVGVNHNTTVGVNGQPAIDGLVAVLDVKITTVPANATSSAGWRLTPPPTTGLLVLLVGALYI